MVSHPKVVFDTNILISAIIFGGNPRACLELARTGEIQLYTTKVLLVELARKLKEKFSWQDEDINEVIKDIVVFAEIIQPKLKLSLIKAYPDDNRVLECAQEANADFIVSGDKKHILVLKKFNNILIITAAEFLKLYFRKSA